MRTRCVVDTRTMDEGGTESSGPNNKPAECLGLPGGGDVEFRTGSARRMPLGCRACSERELAADAWRRVDLVRRHDRI